MTKRGKSPTVTNVTPADLRRIAAMIRRYSSQYDSVAEEMEEAGLESIPATGIASLEGNSLKLIRGHANKLKATVQTQADAKELAALATSRSKYVDDDVSEPKKKARTAKKKDA